jgi:hypothetical protein
LVTSPLLGARLGNGQFFVSDRMARATELIRLAGMKLPVNGWPVSVSRMTVVTPERLPARHSAGATEASCVPGSSRTVFC